MIRITEISQSAGTSTGCGVAVFNSSHLQKFLRNRSRHNAGTARSRDQAYQHRATLASNLARNSVGFTDLITPVTTTNGHNGELGQNDSSTNGSSNFLGALDSKTNVAIVISNS